MMGKWFRLSGWDPVFFISHLLFLVICYSIYLAPYIAPSTFAYFGFIPILYPVLMIINLLLIVILFIRRAPYALVFLILSMGLYKPLSKTYQFFGKEMSTKPDFKILTFNVHLLRAQGFDEFFSNQNADVLFLQEVFRKSKKIETFNDSSLKDYYREKSGVLRFYSKYPIVEFKKIDFTETAGRTACAAYADIDTGKDTIRIINVYLESMLINKKLVTDAIDHEKVEENSIKIKNKLTQGFLIHEQQIKKIIPYIINSKHPVILAGDLNSVPNSYEYKQFLFYLNDAYYTVGQATGTTFHDFKYPIRIDYIFHSQEILPVKVEVLHDTKLSDHYPVVGYFKLP